MSLFAGRGSSIKTGVVLQFYEDPAIDSLGAESQNVVGAWVGEAVAALKCEGFLVDRAGDVRRACSQIHPRWPGFCAHTILNKCASKMQGLSYALVVKIANDAAKKSIINESPSVTLPLLYALLISIAQLNVLLRINEYIIYNI